VTLVPNNRPDQAPDDVDCYYASSNLVPGLDLTTVLNLDPYFNADTAFNPDDLAAGVLAQLQRGGRTWAYPLVIEPQVIHYYADILARDGIPTPTNGVWTADQFANALAVLKDAIPEERKAFTNHTPGDTYLLQLIAAFGGLPLDFRTDPPTVNFTDPATVSAIQQALDLAKNGYMDYQALASNFFTLAIRADDQNPDPMYTDSLGGGFAIKGGSAATSANPYQITGYPQGSRYTAVSYDIGAAYIKADAQNADACYHLFGFLVQHPELFQGMPANRSQFNNPTLTTAIGPNAADFFRLLDATLQDPNTVVIPGGFGQRGTANGTDTVIRRILDQAFDNYVLNDADLTSELQTAQSNAENFQTCMNSAPPYDPADKSAYDDAVRGCATSVDPDLATMFPPKQ
jgi:ABC-type glycerol-3-phosphate transport system substrate-binding protein